MNISFKKLWADYGIGALVVLLLLAYGVSLFANYLTSKGAYGMERMDSNINNVYKNPRGVSAGVPPGAPRPSNPSGQNEVFASAKGIQTTSSGAPSSCANTSVANPSDLLPKDANSQWAQLNPQGKGELNNINLLKAGYHIGIDTVGQTLRNANLQIRSEPPNPQLYVGPWNQSTIESDFLRVPLELGQGQL